MDVGRVMKLTDFEHANNVVYLMRRDQRIFENYSVELGYSLTYRTRSKFFIAIDLNMIQLNEQQQTFAIQGLKEMEHRCKEYNIYFHLIDDYKAFLERNNIDCVILDYSPLRKSKELTNEIKDHCLDRKYSLYECDSHNLIPCRLLSTYKTRCYIVRNDLYQHWSTYFKEFVDLREHAYNVKSETVAIVNEFPVQSAVKSSTVFKGGYSHGMREVETFFKTRFKRYAEYRNVPDDHVLSDLSPWLHAGQISAQKVIMMAVSQFEKHDKNLEKFVDELFVWRELAEHFCLHEPNYDNFNGALEWAKRTLNDHRADKREKIYTLEELEDGRTYDKLWNSGQRELRITGKLHGYVRMYWAKQLLKWTESPEKAIEVAVYLNDKYALDGNDPNGYLGIMWSLCGTMDREFGETAINGKIRPMKGRALETMKYVQRWNNARLM